MRNILKIKSTRSSPTSNNYAHFCRTPGVNGIKLGGGGDERGRTMSPFIHHSRRSAVTLGRGGEWGGGAEHHWDLAYIHSSGPEEQREEQDARQSERKMRQQD